MDDSAPVGRSDARPAQHLVRGLEHLGRRRPLRRTMRLRLESTRPRGHRAVDKLDIAGDGRRGQLENARGRNPPQVRKPEGTWLHLVVMIEVQRQLDYLMALRVRNYVDNHHLELWRGRRFGAAERLGPVLPLVIYTGAQRWTAAARAIDLVTPPAADGPVLGPASRRLRDIRGTGRAFRRRHRRRDLLTCDRPARADQRLFAIDRGRAETSWPAVKGANQPIVLAPNAPSVDHGR